MHSEKDNEFVESNYFFKNTHARTHAHTHTHTHTHTQNTFFSDLYKGYDMCKIKRTM